ncbi:MAG: hypothetical protein WAK17_20420 [Candidatus Nitrosopolaris sp.]|jgi:hypothetical protein
MTSILFALIFTTIGLLTSSAIIVNASTHHQHQYHQYHKVSVCKPPYTTLYVYTQPESKECWLLVQNTTANGLGGGQTGH